MQKLKLTLIFILLLSLFVTSSPPAMANSDIINQTITSNVITRGVVHKNVVTFSKDGWMDINILEIDLREKHIDVDTIFSPRGISKRDPLSTMVNNSGALAAVNGDFFSVVANSSPIGPVVQGGQLIAAPYTDNPMASFGITKDRIPFIDFFTREAMIYARDTKKTLNIGGMNKEVTDYSRIMYYDSNWGEKSIGSSAKYPDMVEMVVLGDTVIEIRQSQEATVIPQNGYVLTATGNGSKFLLENFKVGSEIYAQISLTPNLWSLSTAIGGGGVLLRDGQVALPFNHEVPGRAPRTAVGYNKNKTKLYMVTVDGRLSSSRGMTQRELAEFMRDFLGCYEALNLDGGGSTTMLARLPGAKSPTIVNNLSDGSERSVSNGLAVFSKAPVGSLNSIRIELKDSNVFAGSSREVRVVGLNQYHNPIDIDMSQVTFSNSGVQGSFNGNIFTPSTPGSGTITARIGNISASTPISVLDYPVVIEAQPRVLKLDFDELADISVYGIDKDGSKAYINARDLTWSISDSLGTIEQGVFKAGMQPGKGIIGLSLNGSKTSIGFTIGYNREYISRFLVLPGVFVSFPSEVTGSFQLDRDIKYSGINSGRLDYDFSKAKGTRAAYIGLDGDQGRLLPMSAAKITMQVYGNNSNHWLRANIIDASGKSHNINFERYINWEDWKEVEAVIPSSLPQPITLKRIYIVETDETNNGSGSIYFDNIEVLSNIDFTLDIPDNTEFVDYKRTVPNSIASTFSYFGDISRRNTLLDGIILNRVGQISALSNRSWTGNVNGFRVEEVKEATIVSIDTSKGGIRTTDFAQWKSLQNALVEAKGKNIIVQMSTPLWGEGGFTDPLEAKLLHENLRVLNKNVFVISPSKAIQQPIVREGVRYLTVSPLTGLGQKSIDFDSYQYLQIYIDPKGDMQYQYKLLFE